MITLYYTGAQEYWYKGIRVYRNTGVRVYYTQCNPYLELSPAERLSELVTSTILEVRSALLPLVSALLPRELLVRADLRSAWGRGRAEARAGVRLGQIHFPMYKIQTRNPALCVAGESEANLILKVLI